MPSPRMLRILHNITDDDISQMRDWLSEYSWRNADPEDFHDRTLISDDDVVAGVDRHYAGGIGQFLTDGQAA